MEPEHEDRTLVAVTLRGDDGSIVRIKRGESYSNNMYVYVPAEPETVERWLVQHKNGRKLLEHEHEASDLAEAVKHASDRALRDENVTVTQVRVVVDESSGAPSEDPDDAIPF